jgi:hypothetical protein
MELTLFIISTAAGIITIFAFLTGRHSVSDIKLQIRIRPIDFNFGDIVEKKEPNGTKVFFLIVNKTRHFLARSQNPHEKFQTRWSPGKEHLILKSQRRIILINWDGTNRKEYEIRYLTSDIIPDIDLEWSRDGRLIMSHTELLSGIFKEGENLTLSIRPGVTYITIDEHNNIKEITQK